MGRPDCFKKAADLLARRPHFRRELEQKLSRRGYPADEIEQALGRLLEYRLIDDAGLARDFVRHRLAREPMGRRRLRYELERRGAGDEAAAALAELYPEEDVELAWEATERWRRRRPQGEAAALARYLQRRGFSSRAIVHSLRESGLQEQGF